MSACRLRAVPSGQKIMSSDDILTTSFDLERAARVGRADEKMNTQWKNFGTPIGRRARSLEGEQWLLLDLDMSVSERIPLVHGDAALSKATVFPGTLGKTAWSFCMGLILMSLAVLGVVVSVGSLRGGVAVHGAHRDDAHFIKTGVNDTIPVEFVETDYDVKQPALGEAEPEILGREDFEPLESATNARAKAVHARRVEQRTASRVANREKADAVAVEALEQESNATQVAEEGLPEVSSEDAAAEQRRQAARAQRVRERERARAVAQEGEGKGAGGGKIVSDTETSSTTDGAEQTVEPAAETEPETPSEVTQPLTPEEAAEKRREAARARRVRIRELEQREEARAVAVAAASAKADADAVALSEFLVPEATEEEPERQLPEMTPTPAPTAAAQLPEPTPGPTPVPTPVKVTKDAILSAAESAVATAVARAKGNIADAQAVNAPAAPEKPSHPPVPPRPPLSAQDLLDAIAADAIPHPPPAPYPPLPPSPPPSPPPPPPPVPRPPHPPQNPPIGQPPAAFHSLVPLPGIVADVGPVTGPPTSGAQSTTDAQGETWTTVLTKDTTEDESSVEGKDDESTVEESFPSSLGSTEHLGVVSAFWEAPLADDGRWHSSKRDKTADYYRKGLDNLVRAAARSGNSAVVFTAHTTNDCQYLEAAYAEGSKGYANDELMDPQQQQTTLKPRFLCVKLPLTNLHYGDWHLADHSLVKNMPCSNTMRDTKLIWLNKINLVESASHLLQLPGGKTATKMEWIDADQYAERADLGSNVGGAEGNGIRLDHLSQWLPVPEEGSFEKSEASFGATNLDSVQQSHQPPPGFKIIPGMQYSFSALKQLPGDLLQTGGQEDKWQVDAKSKVDEQMESASSSLGESGSTSKNSLPFADRVQMGCYAPKQRVGPCTSNHFVASRFRATPTGIAAIRQLFEDVIYDYKHEFPGPGFDGWSVQNLTWGAEFNAEHDREGYPTHAFMYARDGFKQSKQDWCCVCSTEEMVYNKMYRRNPGLFLPDVHCDHAAPYEVLEKGEEKSKNNGARRLLR